VLPIIHHRLEPTRPLPIAAVSPADLKRIFDGCSMGAIFVNNEAALGALWLSTQLQHFHKIESVLVAFQPGLGIESRAVLILGGVAKTRFSRQ